MRKISKEERKEKEESVELGLETPIKWAGGFLREFEIFYEPISPFYYLYNCKGNIGISKVEKGQKPIGKRLTDCYIIQIENKRFELDKKPETPIWVVPSLEEVQDFINGEFPVNTSQEIFGYIKYLFKILFDVIDKSDYSVSSLGSMQSWLCNFIDTVFYNGFEAKPGSGKTKRLEATTPLIYHGFLAGNLTAAGLARLNDEQRISLAIDEIDQRKDDTIGVCRQGYRQGSPYIRCHPLTHSPERFDVFGYKLFTFYKIADPALHQRTIISRIRPTKDNRLGVINAHASEYAKQIAPKIFFWYMQNCHKFFLRSLQCLLYFPGFLHRGQKDVELVRNEMFNKILERFNEKEKELIKKLYGRNQELAMCALNLIKIFELDNKILKDIEVKFMEKDELDQLNQQTTHREIFLDCLRDCHRGGRIILKGEFEGSKIYPKKELYTMLQNKLLEAGVSRISNTTFDHFLADIGFIDNVNIKRQYYNDSNLVCLVYTPDILESLNITQPKVCEEKIK